MDVTRRTVVRTAAWTVPVLATIAQAPAFAASPCAAIPFPTGWSTSTTGTFALASGVQGYQNYGADGLYRFVSERDTSNLASEANAANGAVINHQFTLNLLPGRPYTFDLSVGSRYAGDKPSTAQNQFLQVQTIASGVTTDHLRLVKGANPNTYVGALGSWQQLSTVTPGQTIQPFRFTYTPPAGVNSFMLRYRFVLPSLGKVGGGAWEGNNDIAVSAPTLTGC